MKKILDIPYYSQHEDVKDEYWKPRACGAVCLKMVLDFLKPDEISVNDFVLLANEKGAYCEHGWVHQGLIDIAKEFGVELERKEFKPLRRLHEYNEVIQEKDLLDQGISEIIESINNNKPVIVSAIKKWSEEKKFHMVVLTGFEMDEDGELKGFYYNDTDYQNESEGKDLFVDIETFKTCWRRLAIFVK